MVTISYNDMHNLIDHGNTAREYALEHYEELAKREACYTLFGPHTNFLGAASPSHHIRAHQRKLMKNTRREKYTKYELDATFHVIRVTHIYQYEKVESVYHIFDLDGITYGCAFAAKEKWFVGHRTEAFMLSANKHLYYAQTSHDSIFCEFYEYPDDDKRLCTGYLYSRICQKTAYGLTPNWDAPFGAPDSPVSLHSYEDDPIDLDFSKYFTES